MHHIRIVRSPVFTWLLAPSATLRIPADGENECVIPARLVNDISKHRFDEPPQDAPYGATVLTSTDCKFACFYCFQNEQSEGGLSPQRIPKLYLTAQRAVQIASFILASARAQEKERVKLLLFGGEPLLAPQACRALLEELHEHLSSASMVTNGYMLTGRLAQSLQSVGLRHVQVTLDGAQSDHDRIRHTRGMQHTYERILRNLQEVQAQTDIRIAIRVNVTHDNASTIRNLLDDLQSQLDARRTTIQFAIVRDYRWNQIPAHCAESADLVTQLIQVARIAKEVGFALASPSGYDCSFCSGSPGHTGAVVTPDGYLYSSWETAGRAEYRVGSITDGYTRIDEQVWLSCEQFHSRQQASSASYNVAQDRLDAQLLDIIHGYASNE